MRNVIWLASLQYLSVQAIGLNGRSSSYWLFSIFKSTSFKDSMMKFQRHHTLGQHWLQKKFTVASSKCFMIHYFQVYFALPILLAMDNFAIHFFLVFNLKNLTVAFLVMLWLSGTSNSGDQGFNYSSSIYYSTRSPERVHPVDDKGALRLSVLHTGNVKEHFLFRKS